MKKVMLTVTGVLLTGTFLFGFKDTLLRIKAGVSQVRTAIDEASSTSHLTAVAKAQLEAAEERLSDAESVMADYRTSHRRLSGEVAQMEARLTAARCGLEKLRAAVSSGGSYTAAGSTWTPCQVKADAAQLVEWIAAAESKVSAKRAQLSGYEKVIAGTRADMESARQEISETRQRVDQLAAALEAEQAAGEAREAAAAARGNVTAEMEGDLARTVGVLEKRLEKLQRRNAASGAAAALPRTAIPLDDAGLSQRIETILGKPAPAEAAPAASPAPTIAGTAGAL